MGGRKGWVCLALGGISLLFGPERAKAADRVPRLLLPFDAAAVQRTVESARARLHEPSCQSLLEEFKAEDGLNLQAHLAGSGKTLDGHLSELHFLDASELPACRSARVYAFTRPGFGAVYVCTRQFTAARLRDPRLVEAVVIHELLHTIGLGENPPSPEYITARVQDRCHGRGVTTQR
jgi:hypothetical protein